GSNGGGVEIDRALEVADDVGIAGRVRGGVVGDVLTGRPGGGGPPGAGGRGRAVLPRPQPQAGGGGGPGGGGRPAGGAGGGGGGWGARGGGGGGGRGAPARPPPPPPARFPAETGRAATAFFGNVWLLARPRPRRRGDGRTLNAGLDFGDLGPELAPLG